jgi:glycosyltransferase involved in cell wall biosynthesis
VLYEAMRWGLPVIAAKRGGPEWIVDETCGVRLDVSTPEDLARDVAGAIRQLADNPGQRRALGQGGRDKLLREGLWPVKAAALVELYQDILGAAQVGQAA